MDTSSNTSEKANPQADPKGLLNKNVATPHHSSWEMRRALRLAEKARGFTLPNPMVGAVLINKDGERIGEGYHTAYGAAHAEVEALKNCDAKGATLYVTLEPCCHHGKTPPCVDAIIESGIAKVVISSLDPSDKVNGKGAAALKAAGIEVEVGLLKEEAEELNREFYTFHKKKRPFITLKAALSLDGKIAETAGEETALTGKQVQKQVHILRSEHQAILVGAGTVLADDPHLGVRVVEGRNPLRIILQGKRKLPKTAQIFRDDNVLVLKDLPMEELMETLYEKGILSVLVEGGHEVFESFLEAGLADEIQIFQAPVFLGEKAVPFTNGAHPLQLKKSRQLGQDLWLTLNLKGNK
ncbi:MAG: bifunctional diaminohydroxyphosphoribosylaminopyrimidine deaminase/5-amino-6-(5-phosphoribosylamino)uracil reductase RibD [Patescibacteria group bacterium]